MNVSVSVFALAFTLVAVVLWGAGAVAWQAVTSPAVDLFGVTSATLGTGCFVIAFGYAVSDPLTVLGGAIAVGMLIPIPWVVFSFDYVGKEAFVSTRVTAVLAGPVVFGLSATIALFAEELIPWFSLPSQAGASGLLAVIVTGLRFTQWVGLLYAGGLMLVGTGLILWTFQRYKHLDTTTGVVLCSFGSVPWLSILFGLQLEGISFLAFGTTLVVGFGTGAASAVALVGPADLFERVPAAGNVGPETVIEELEDAIVITDGEERVVELNDAASHLFGGQRGANGQPIASLLGTSLDGLRTNNVVELEGQMGRSLVEPRVSKLTDQHGTSLGYAVVLRDVTDRQTRQQRLEVLNRLLRHNLRNDMSVVIGYAQVIRNGVEDPELEDSALKITNAGEELVDLSERARKTEQLLAASEQTATYTPLEPLVKRLTSTLESEYEVVLRQSESASVAIETPPERLRLALRSVIQNVVRQSEADTPHVEIQTAYYPDAVYQAEISVVDDRSTIPEMEQDVIQMGGETSMDHTSGIGLWTARWIATSLGGKLTFTDRESGGTVVTLALPQADAVDSLSPADRERIARSGQ